MDSWDDSRCRRSRPVHHGYYSDEEITYRNRSGIGLPPRPRSPRPAQEDVGYYRGIEVAAAPEPIHRHGRLPPGHRQIPEIRYPREPARYPDRPIHRHSRSNPASPDRLAPSYHRPARAFLTPERRHDPDVSPPTRSSPKSPSKRWNEELLDDSDIRRPPRPRSASDIGLPKVASKISSSSAASSAPSSGTGGRVYRYQELRPSDFRLIRIHPAKITTIRCSIEHASLKRPPKYVAISYAWGDIGDTKEIQIDGIPIRITTSLHGALEALRQKSGSVLVWADFVSIDQHNREEKMNQVQLMATIYARAESVAIWLGPEGDNSSMALEFLREAAHFSDSTDDMRTLIASRYWKRQVAATVSLFERDYWRRLWVVQEVLNAKTIWVYCGSSPKVHWDEYLLASRAFRRHKPDLEYYFPAGIIDGKHYTVSKNRQTFSNVLVKQGPQTFTDLKSLIGLGGHRLHEALRRCREKLTADPKDKLYGILGILAEEVREYLPADYSLSVREVYTSIVDFIVRTTDRLDIIGEAIYFPLHTSSTTLPTWVPDWSHIPETAGLGLSYNFSAAGNTKARYRFVDERRNKLEISAIHVDTVRVRGIAVGTLSGTSDFLMAFLHWRALLLDSPSLRGASDGTHTWYQEAFCRTLCLNQFPPKWDDSRKWTAVCYHVFASLINERLKYLPLDQELRLYINADLNITPDARRQILRQDCGSRMTARCFYLTEDGMGMGSGFMAPGDIIVVPLGCSTPLILRLEGSSGEYRVVGDVYIDGYMYGEAVHQWKHGKRKLEVFILH